MVEIGSFVKLKQEGSFYLNTRRIGGLHGIVVESDKYGLIISLLENGMKNFYLQHSDIEFAS